MALFNDSGSLDMNSIIQALTVLNARPGEANDAALGALRSREEMRRRKQEEDEKKRLKASQQRFVSLLTTDPNDDLSPQWMPEGKRQQLAAQEAMAIGRPDLAMSLLKTEPPPKPEMPDIGMLNLENEIIPYNKSALQRIAGKNPDSLFFGQGDDGYLRFPIGRSPNAVPRMPPGQTAEETARGKRLIDKVYDSAMTDAKAARQMNQKLGIQLNLLDEGMTTGKGIPLASSLAGWLSTLGVDNEKIKSLASDSEKFTAMTMGLVADIQIPQSGPQTESDAKRYQQTVGNLESTEEANKFITSYAIAQNNLKQEYADFLMDWQAKKGSLEGAEYNWTKQQGRRSLFEDPVLRKWRDGGIRGNRPASQRPSTDSLIDKYRTR